MISWSTFCSLRWTIVIPFLSSSPVPFPSSAHWRAWICRGFSLFFITGGGFHEWLFSLGLTFLSVSFGIYSGQQLGLRRNERRAIVLKFSPTSLSLSHVPAFLHDETARRPSYSQI
jgi:hypothetical protein